MIRIEHLLQRIWIEEIEPLYNAGYINGRETLIAYLFKFLSQELPSDMILWCYPKLHIALTKGNYSLLDLYVLRRRVATYRPDLIITSKDRVIGLVSIRYSPKGFTNYRNDLFKLFPLIGLLGKGELFLKIHPDRGEPNEAYPYVLDPHLLLVYGVISKSSGFALDIEELKKDVAYVSENFLHLTASVQQNKVIFNSKLC